MPLLQKQDQLSANFDLGRRKSDVANFLSIFLSHVAH